MIASGISTERIDTKQLLLLDEIGRPAIRMQTLQNGTKMEFLANGNIPILTLRVDRDTLAGLIEFTGMAGRHIAGFQVRPNSESELFLGDKDMEGRVILGAPGTDEGDQTEMWGLQIQSYRAGGATVGVANDNFKEPRGPYFGYRRADRTFVPGAAIPKVQ